MRRPWIKIETSTPDKPEICHLSNTLRMDSDTVVGKLVRLWGWMELNRVPANDLGVTKVFLDKLVGRKGFADALIGSGWLVEQGEKLSFRNMDRHNGGKAKIRAMTAQRVALHRQRKLISNESTDTKSLQNAPQIVEIGPDLKDEVSKENNVKTPDKQFLESNIGDIDPSLSSNVYVTNESEGGTADYASQSMAEIEVKTPLQGKFEADGMTEPVAKKRRGRGVGESPDQPSLF